MHGGQVTPVPNDSADIRINGAQSIKNAGKKNVTNNIIIHFVYFRKKITLHRHPYEVHKIARVSK
jgi:hypothetical protein